MNDTCPTCGYTTSVNGRNYCERYGCGKTAKLKNIDGVKVTTDFVGIIIYAECKCGKQLKKYDPGFAARIDENDSWDGSDEFYYLCCND